MAKYRAVLPQVLTQEFLTDGGLETTLTYRDGLELPFFAAFPLVRSEEGRARLKAYFLPYLTLAAEYGKGFILDTPTWRANPDWGRKLDYSCTMLEEVQRASVRLAMELRPHYETCDSRIVINGVIGPRGDGYRIDTRMNARQAQLYHQEQVKTFARTEADMVSAITMTYSNEAIGIAAAAQAHRMPVVVSFTVETDGRLPSGETLGHAIERVDEATEAYPLYYMINCAHPLHFERVISGSAPWLDRIGGLRANASTLSHTELDMATELDAGDPLDLAHRYRGLRKRLKNARVLGGCCGTDLRHVRAICYACL
ncbi:homocysteine S-methyltransferase family protein [Bosea sp. 2KB_26]|uniref:homocysteine S-methyltransferase family protein n=1 Tax=Bosea sp. 2KB_26 TaxID=3237475 RepID=UPI000DE1CA32